MLNTNEEQNIYYEPQFYYSFGYADYSQDSWGFSYSNYQNNRFNSSGDPYASSFVDGSWEVNYRKKIQNFSLKAAFSYSPSDDERILSLSSSNKIFENTKLKLDYERYLVDPQDRLAISIKTKFKKRFFIEGGIYLYSDVDKKEEYEGDYYYAFGWKDERPYHFSFVYSNQYTGTRHPWSDQPDIPLNSGALTISYNF